MIDPKHHKELIETWMGTLVATADNAGVPRDLIYRTIARKVLGAIWLQEAQNYRSNGIDVDNAMELATQQLEILILEAKTDVAQWVVEQDMAGQQTHHTTEKPQ